MAARGADNGARGARGPEEETRPQKGRRRPGWVPVWLTLVWLTLV